MKSILWLGLGWCLMVRAADEPASAPRPRAVPVGAAHAETSDDPGAHSVGDGARNPGAAARNAADAARNPAEAARTAGDAAPVKFSTTDKWVLAGYNNNEIVYTIIVANEDTRILHCTTLMQGWYYENGKKLPISDRQSTTVFPNQPTQVGNWMDMDQQSGATYSVKCRPI
jgi:hypothetical protein